MLTQFQFVPHDVARLIKLQGGQEDFISRLDFIFDQVWLVSIHSSQTVLTRKIM